MFNALLKSHSISEKSADNALNDSTSSGNVESTSNQFQKKLDKLMGTEETIKRAAFEDKYSLIGKTYGTSTFESFARDGSTRYQDLWLKNPIDPFAVTSVHSLSQNIPSKMESEGLKARLSSCMNLTKKTSNLYNNVLSETENSSFKRYDSLSNHASASSSEYKLSDISTPRHSFEYLKGDGNGSKYYSKYDLDKPRTVDVPYPHNTNLFSKIDNNLPENIPGNKLFFKSAKRSTDIEKSVDCLEQIKKCLEDLNV